MKRIVSLLISVLLVANVAFARNFFDGRFFEVRADVPFGISNNVFSLDDILVQDLVIDLPKINSEVPEKNGLTTIIRLDPSVSTKLRIAGFSIGAEVGADVYVKFGLSKGLFEFLGNGYNIGDTFDISLVDPIVDTFAYVNAPMKLELGKFTFGLTPSTFLPVIAMKDSATKATVVNDKDGNVVIEMKNNMNFYTTPLVGEQLKGMMPSDNGSNVQAGATVPNENQGTSMPSFSELGHYLGFDLGASVKYQFNKRFDVRADMRFPIVPAKLDTNMNVKNSFNMSMNIMGMTKGESPKQEPMTNDITLTKLDDPVKLNRPLKFNAYADYKLLGFLDFTAGGGLGIRRPGSDDFYAYPEYYLAAGINLFQMLKASVSTEYTDQLFRHAFNFVLNLRFVEVDAGVSLEASNFAKSFTGAGLGGYVGVVVGF